MKRLLTFSVLYLFAFTCEAEKQTPPPVYNPPPADYDYRLHERVKRGGRVYNNKYTPRPDQIYSGEIQAFDGELADVVRRGGQVYNNQYTPRPSYHVRRPPVPQSSGRDYFFFDGSYSHTGQ